MARSISHNVFANTATLYSHCDPSLIHSTEILINGTKIRLSLIFNASIIIIDCLVALSTSIYFGIKLCQLRTNILTLTSEDNRSDDPQLKLLATRILASGFLAISSTLLFFIMASVSPPLINLLPLDSCIYSAAVIVSFDIKYKSLFNQYICWPRYYLMMKIEENVHNNTERITDGTTQKTDLPSSAPETNSNVTTESDIGLPNLQVHTSASKYSLRSLSARSASPCESTIRISQINPNTVVVLELENNNSIQKFQMSAVIH
eukprot:106868_1